MMKELEALLANTNKHVMTFTELLVGIEMALKEGDITQDEYIDVMIDVERLKKIITLKEDLELNKLIHDAVVAIIELAKMVKQ
jgi:hypothetical protein